MNALAEILSSKIRAEIFRLLFGINHKELHMREIQRITGYAIGSIQTECKKLRRLDLVDARRDGNRLYYSARDAHPLYNDIRNMVLKTVGLADVIRNAIEKHPGISVAFVFGSVARMAEKSGSDIDLMVIGDVGFRELTGLLSGLSEKVGRELNPHVLKPHDYKERLIRGDHFIQQITESEKLFVKGSHHELDSMAE